MLGAKPQVLIGFAKICFAVRRSVVFTSIPVVSTKEIRESRSADMFFLVCLAETGRMGVSEGGVEGLF